MRLTNVGQPLKCLNRLSIPHTVAPSRDYAYRIWFQINCLGHVANERYFNGLLKGVFLDQFQNQFRRAQYAWFTTLRRQCSRQTFHPYCYKFCPLPLNKRPKIGLVHHLT